MFCDGTMSQGSTAVTRSMAEIDLAAKRHAIAGRKGQGADDGGLFGHGADADEDPTLRAEKQVSKTRNAEILFLSQMRPQVAGLTTRGSSVRTSFF